MCIVEYIVGFFGYVWGCIVKVEVWGMIEGFYEFREGGFIVG